MHATFLLSKLVLPGMLERGWGRIVNVTSESAIGPGAAPYSGALVGDTAYGAQKAAIERFSQGLAEEVYPDGVGVAAIAPSLIVPTPGALANGQITGVDDPRVEDPALHAGGRAGARHRPARGDGRARRLQPAAAAGEGADREGRRAWAWTRRAA